MEENTKESTKRYILKTILPKADMVYKGRRVTLRRATLLHSYTRQSVVHLPSSYPPTTIPSPRSDLETGQTTYPTLTLHTHTRSVALPYTPAACPTPYPTPRGRESRPTWPPDHDHICRPTLQAPLPGGARSRPAPWLQGRTYPTLPTLQRPTPRSRIIRRHYRVAARPTTG